MALEAFACLLYEHEDGIHLWISLLSVVLKKHFYWFDGVVAAVGQTWVEGQCHNKDKRMKNMSDAQTRINSFCYSLANKMYRYVRFKLYKTLMSNQL